MKFNILVQRKMKAPEYLTENNLFLKQLWIPQAKQVIKLFKANLTAMVNGLIKITSDYQVDFTFIDKVISNIVGIDKKLLHSALSNMEL